MGEIVSATDLPVSLLLEVLTPSLVSMRLHNDSFFGHPTRNFLALSGGASYPFRVEQATSSNTGPRKVEVEVELGAGKGGSFLVVKDNGRGMNAKGLKDFATYFLTQENRGVSGPQASRSTKRRGNNTSYRSQVSHGFCSWHG